MIQEASEKWFPRRRRVWLMRHGEVDYFDAAGRPHRPESVTLNALGQEQARAAGVSLENVPLDRAIHSGLDRTRQTLNLVLGARALPVTEEPRFREIQTGRMSDWAGADPAAVRDAILRALPANLNPEDRFLGGETYASLGERVGAAWRELLADESWKQVLIVAHGVVNRFLIAGCLGASLAAMGALEQDAGCINLIEVDNKGGGLVRKVNFTPLSPVKQGLELSTLEGLFQQYLRGHGMTGQE